MDPIESMSASGPVPSDFNAEEAVNMEEVGGIPPLAHHCYLKCIGTANLLFLSAYWC